LRALSEPTSDPGASTGNDGPLTRNPLFSHVTLPAPASIRTVNRMQLLPSGKIPSPIHRI